MTRTTGRLPRVVHLAASTVSAIRRFLTRGRVRIPMGTDRAHVVSVRDFFQEALPETHARNGLSTSPYGFRILRRPTFSPNSVNRSQVFVEEQFEDTAALIRLNCVWLRCIRLLSRAFVARPARRTRPPMASPPLHTSFGSRNGQLLVGILRTHRKWLLWKGRKGGLSSKPVGVAADISCRPPP